LGPEAHGSFHPSVKNVLKLSGCHRAGSYTLPKSDSRNTPNPVGFSAPAEVACAAPLAPGAAKVAAANSAIAMQSSNVDLFRFHNIMHLPIPL
jgi:hypothetical protein